MSHSWFLFEKEYWMARHKEILRAAEKERLAQLLSSGQRDPIYAKALSNLGYQLVSIGTWLQYRFGGILDYKDFEAKDPAWRS